MHTLINSVKHFDNYRKLTNKLVATGEMQRENVNQLLRYIQQKLDDNEWNNVHKWLEENEEQNKTTTTTSDNIETTTSKTSITVLSTAILTICISLNGVSILSRVGTENIFL
jgi:hypothetical protein